MTEENLTEGPLEDRLQHKNWKVRVAAYEELKKKYALAEDDNAPIFSEFGTIHSLCRFTLSLLLERIPTLHRIFFCFVISALLSCARGTFKENCRRQQCRLSG
jgi:hypothetical protein